MSINIKYYLPNNKFIVIKGNLACTLTIMYLCYWCQGHSWKKNEMLIPLLQWRTTSVTFKLHSQCNQYSFLCIFMHTCIYVSIQLAFNVDIMITQINTAEKNYSTLQNVRQGSQEGREQEGGRERRVAEGHKEQWRRINKRVKMYGKGCFVWEFVGRKMKGGRVKIFVPYLAESN